ncbi:MAG: TonB-dependent receptor [Bacteroidetes bacterium]|nr:TonB-dependent receptor [Bacteroidota bacterium]
MVKMVPLLIMFGFITCNMELHSQTGMVSGTVYDAETNEVLPGVNILADSAYGTSTDSEGRYYLHIAAGEHQLIFRFLGFSEYKLTLKVRVNETIKRDIYLSVGQIELDAAVVTAGKYQQKLSDVTVSMAIIQSDFIENTNTMNMADAISKQPGVDVIDGQPNIRGGSGYSYGAGSRVMVLVDGLPMLTADVNEVKWNFLPVENIERVEILKGASSALYGSSALNGVINLITTWPGTRPKTKFNLYSGLYMQPQRKELAWWWDGNPIFGGASFSTAHKMGNWDLVAGGNYHNDPGYRKDDYEQRIRANLKIRHHPAGIKGLTYGLNTNFQWQNTSDFLIWVDADSGALMQPLSSVNPSRALRFNVDPWVRYYDRHHNRHSLRTRFYKVYNRFEEDPDKNNGSDLYFGEYQFYRNFSKKLDWTFGISGLYGVTNAELYGDHFNSTIAVFTQLDYKLFNQLSVSVGLRWEHYTLDQKDTESSPVARAGLNYQAAEHTFLRASIGQGFRFPSIAEKYISTSVGSLNIFPNSELKSENGWSAEIGIKQGIKISNWKGYFDLAGFYTEYEDMIEFTFGVWNDDQNPIVTLDDIGFKSLNVGKARINGIDMSITGTGKVGKMPLTLFAGYTYMNPIDLSSDTLENNILKYRYRHAVKSDAEIKLGRFTTGLTITYTSFMERIDDAFEATILGQEIFPGLKQYRIDNDKGALIIDYRIAYRVSDLFKIALLANNLLNNEYMGRPGDIRPPRNVIFQVSANF